MRKIWLCTTVAFVLGLAGSPTKAGNAEPRLSSPCSMNFSLLGQSKTFDPLSKIVFEQAPPAVQPRLQAPHATSTAVISQIPKSEKSFMAVFSTRSVSKTDQRDMESASNLLLKSKIIDIPAVKSEDFDKVLRENGAQNIILIGHNDNGRFMFLDGSSSYLWNLSQACANKKKTCIFISCKSNRSIGQNSLGVNRDLTLEEGIFIATKIDQWLKTKVGAVTDSEIAKFVSGVENVSYAKYHLSYIVMNGCGAAAGGYVIYMWVDKLEER